MYAYDEEGWLIGFTIAMTGRETRVPPPSLDPPGPGQRWRWNVAEERWEAQSYTPPTSTQMTHFAFINRLSLEEHIAIELAMPTSPVLRVAKQRFDAAREVDVALPQTAQLIGLLAQLGVIEPERVGELLLPIALTERGAINPKTGAITP